MADPPTTELDTDKLDKIHPIALGVILLLGDGNDKPDQVELTDDIVEDLQAELHALIGSEELRWALGSLLDLVSSLEVGGMKPVAKALLDALQTEEMLEAMDKLNVVRAADQAEDVASGEERFKKLSGEQTTKLAPTDEDDVPDDAVNIGELDFPKYV